MMLEKPAHRGCFSPVFIDKNAPKGHTDHSIWGRWKRCSGRDPWQRPVLIDIGVWRFLG
jgi:hypothetical protein